MNPRLQSASAVLVIAVILVIVYSPYVDLPLTETRTNHYVLQLIHAPAVSPAMIAGAVHTWIGVTLYSATAVASDVVAIKCAYLC